VAQQVIMARELTDGFAIAAQLTESVASDIFASALLSTMPKFQRQVDGGVQLEAWFGRPSLSLVANANPAVNTVQVRLPLTARASNRFDETAAEVVARPVITQEEVEVNGRRTIHPSIDFRGLGANAYQVTADIPEFVPLIRTAIVNQLRERPPLSLAPLVTGVAERVHIRTYTEDAGTANGDLVVLFADDRPGGSTPTPPRVVERTNSTTVLVPRELIDEKIREGLVEQGLGNLPAPVPNSDRVRLNSFAVELRDGHVFVSGTGTKTTEIVVDVETDFTFKAWLQLLVQDEQVTVNVLRTEQDADLLADVLDFFSAGFVTRLMERVVPKAIQSVSLAAFGGLTVFASEVPAGRAFARARASGIVTCFTTGLGVPVQVIAPVPSPAEPTYPFRGNRESREFHVAGCPFGDIMKVWKRVKFPTWQAAVAAGYDGCDTCQTQFNVAAFGVLDFEVDQPQDADVNSLSIVATYTGGGQRFGVPLAPRPERVHESSAGESAVHKSRLSKIVPGAWHLRLEAGTWSTEGDVEVTRMFVNEDGGVEGNPTKVRAVVGQAGIQVG
jgi:hypothetical protein